jgi:cation diffusion facilitator CzcD-associated flavoprotein CzcO
LRRAELPRVNPLIWTNFSGMLGHFAELDDLHRWRFMRYILEKPPMPPPQEAFWRCRKFENFAWHTNCAWRTVRYNGKAATVETNGDPFTFDFVIFATGFETDLAARPELAPIVDHIALWRDRFTPPIGEESDLLCRHPYLGTAFEFTEREPGSAPYLGRLHNFTFGAMPSVGLTGGAITGIKYGVPRLVRGLVRDLFREDAEEHYRELLAYSHQELETLEAPLAWIDNLAREALGGELLADLLSHVRDRSASEPARKDESDPKAGSSKRIRTRQVAARSRNRAVVTKRKKRAGNTR